MILEGKMRNRREEGGRRQDWDEIRRHTDKPIITIITSTYNVVQDLHWTVDSIKEQTYPNIQWIVADGASNDGTIDLLKKYSDIIDYWFSEPDTGIYDAWNKALEHVEGDWVQFIGAGDELFETNTLEEVSSYLKDAYPKYELVYGQVMHISEKSRKELYVSGEPWEHYVGKWEGNRPRLPVQTGMYHHVSNFVDYEISFDTSYKIVADCHLLLKKLKLNKEMKFIPLITTVMPIGGVSSSISGGLNIYLETQRSMNSLQMKLPLKRHLTNSLKYNFVRSFVYILSEKKYEKFIDTIKVIRKKPKIFTVE